MDTFDGPFYLFQDHALDINIVFEFAIAHRIDVNCSKGADHATVDRYIVLQLISQTFLSNLKVASILIEGLDDNH